MKKLFFLFALLLSIVCISCNSSNSNLSEDCCIGGLDIDGDDLFDDFLEETDDFGNLDNLIFAPSAFTADGDGVNDFFSIIARNHEFKELRICTSGNRSVVTITEEPFRWDGTVSGEMCKEGKYKAEAILLSPNGGEGTVSTQFCLLKCIDPDADATGCTFEDGIHPKYGHINATQQKVGCD